MAREIMRRTAGDNPYLHKDFHGALSAGIEYLHRTCGEEAVRRYLWQFATRWYAPLTDDLRRRGLIALQEHFERLYAREGGHVTITRTEKELLLQVEACPAVTHLRHRGYPVAELFHETTRTVNEAICAGTLYTAELLAYDPETGRSTVRFYRREP